MPGKSKVTMFVNSDFSELLNLFNANHVKYLVISGYAVIQYAEPRYTKDLDLWISVEKENAAAVYKALKAFGAPTQNRGAILFPERNRRAARRWAYYTLGRQVWRPYIALETPISVAVPRCTMVAGQIDGSTGGEGESRRPR